MQWGKNIWYLRHIYKMGFLYQSPFILFSKRLLCGQTFPVMLQRLNMLKTTSLMVFPASAFLNLAEG